MGGAEVLSLVESVGTGGTIGTDYAGDTGSGTVTDGAMDAGI